MKQNYIDGKGNYHNEQNLTLTQIYDSGVEFGCEVTAKGIVEELEKIKAEFEDKILLNQTVAIQIIDKHIKELKGENNPDCRNCDKWKTCESGEKGHANGTSIGYSIGECRDYAELKGE